MKSKTIARSVISFGSTVGVLIAGSLILSACAGQRVRIDSGFIGLIVNETGIQPGTIEPSTFRMEACMWPWSVCPRLLLVEASDQGIEEQIRVMMPQEQLNIVFDLRATLRVTSDDETIFDIVNRMSPQPYPGESYVDVITFDRVYTTYAQPVIREVARSVITQYSIEEVMANRDTISIQIRTAMEEALTHTPFTVVQMGLADMQYPGVIIAAREAAEQRRIDIEREEAERQIRLIQAQTELEVAQAQQAIRLTEAETIRLENEEVAESVTPQYIMYRMLEVQQQMAMGDSTVIFPAQFMTSIQDAVSVMENFQAGIDMMGVTNGDQ